MAIERDVLTRMAEADEPLVRWEGGYWTLDGQHAAGHAWPSGYALPRWYVGIGAVRALEEKGLLRRLHRFVEEWRDSRELTEIGRLAAAGARDLADSGAAGKVTQQA